MYRVCMDCNGKNIVYMWVVGKVNRISNVLARYRSIQDDK
jgi:hypothetical protein